MLGFAGNLAVQHSLQVTLASPMKMTASRFALVAALAIAVGVTMALLVYATLIAAVGFVLIAALVALVWRKRRRIT